MLMHTQTYDAEDYIDNSARRKKKSELNRICLHKEKKNTANETLHFECVQCKGQTRTTRCNVSYSIPTNAQN